MATTTNLQRLFARPGSNPASPEEIIEEMLDTQLGRDFGPEKVAQLVQDFAKTSTFELWQNMLQWRIALDEHKSKTPRLDELRISIVLRLWVAQSFRRLPRLKDMPRGPREAREEFLRFSIMTLEDELACCEDFELLTQLVLFRAKLDDGDF